MRYLWRILYRHTGRKDTGGNSIDAAPLGGILFKVVGDVGNMTFQGKKALGKAKTGEWPLRGDVGMICGALQLYVGYIVNPQTSQVNMVKHFISVNRICAKVNGCIDLYPGNIPLSVKSACNIDFRAATFW